MKVRVIVPSFKDKVTGSYHSKGDVIDVSSERYKEISEKGAFVEQVRGKKAATDATDEPDSKDDQEESAEEPEPSSLLPPLHEYEGVAYEELEQKRVNNVQPQAEGKL